MFCQIVLTGFIHALLYRVGVDYYTLLYSTVDKQVCMYICMYVRTYVYMYVCTYVCMCVYVFVCMYVCIYVCTYVHTYVCMYICTYICMYICMYSCMYVVLVYVHTHVHVLQISAAVQRHTSDYGKGDIPSYQLYLQLGDIVKLSVNISPEYVTYFSISLYV